MFNLAYKLIAGSEKCTELIHLVPRPFNHFSNPFTQLGKQAVKAFLKAISDNEEHYVLCLKGAAYHYASAFRLAANGV